MRTLLIALTLAFGMHHVGPLMGVGDGHHSAAPAAASGADQNGVMDGIAGTCLAVLALGLTVPQIRGLFARRAVGARCTQGTAWSRGISVIRGPPPHGLRPSFLLLCALRR